MFTIFKLKCNIKFFFWKAVYSWVFESLGQKCELSEFFIEYSQMDGHTQNLVGIVTSSQAGRSRNTGSIPAGAWDIFFSTVFDIGWGPHPASYSLGIGLTPWVKRLDREVARSPPLPSNAKVKIEWMSGSVPLLPLP